MTTRIVCVGNRFVPEDSLGPEVHARLAGRRLPTGVELIDGGISGLDLLPLVEGAERVVFVDALAGEDAPGEIVVVDGATTPEITAKPYGHDAGLAYLLGVLPRVCDGPPPAWFVVGAEGVPDEALVERVAERALAIALIPDGGAP